MFEAMNRVSDSFGGLASLATQVTELFNSTKASFAQFAGSFSSGVETTASSASQAVNTTWTHMREAAANMGITKPMVLAGVGAVALFLCAPYLSSGLQKISELAGRVHAQFPTTSTTTPGE